MDKKVFLISVTILALWTSSTMGGAVECQSICPLLFQPLCATNENGVMQTFHNECTRTQENCQRKTNFQKTADGPCP